MQTLPVDPLIRSKPCPLPRLPTIRILSLLLLPFLVSHPDEVFAESQSKETSTEEATSSQDRAEQTGQETKASSTGSENVTVTSCITG